MFQCGFSHYMFEATYLHVTFFERCRETLGTLARVRFIYQDVFITILTTAHLADTRCKV